MREDMPPLAPQFLIFYKDGKGEYRFKYKASNGETLTVSSEGYTELRNALIAAQIAHGVPIHAMEYKELREGSTIRVPRAAITVHVSFEGEL